MTRDISIRPATPADLETVASILARTWRETYNGIVPDALVAERSNPAWQVDTWREHFADAGALAGTWLGSLDGEPAGVALVRETPGEDAPRPLELKLCYTLAVAHGSGLGHALIDAAIADRPAWLWMFDGNDRAEAFYRKHGFQREEPWFTRSWGHLYDGGDYRDIRLVR